MIKVTSLRGIRRGQYDEIWAIVRSLKNTSVPEMKQVPVLSPSSNLFHAYLKLRDSGQWNKETFKRFYVPTFLKEMHGAEAKQKLQELVQLDKEWQSICLACFCPDESLCHRSIVAALLQGLGCQVRTDSGIINQNYYFLWKEIPQNMWDTVPDMPRCEAGYDAWTSFPQEWKDWINAMLANC